MNIEPNLTVWFVQPWRAAFCEALQEPLTPASAARDVAYSDRRHRLPLAAKGDTVAEAGVATPLRQAVSKAAAVAATGPRMLARKVTMVMTHRRCSVDHPMALLIEAATVSDIAALQLGAQKQERLLRRLRGEQ